jgi:hypothetical protein
VASVWLIERAQVPLQSLSGSLVSFCCKVSLIPGRLRRRNLLHVRFFWSFHGHYYFSSLLVTDPWEFTSVFQGYMVARLILASMRMGNFLFFHLRS